MKLCHKDSQEEQTLVRFGSHYTLPLAGLVATSAVAMTCMYYAYRKLGTTS